MEGAKVIGTASASNGSVLRELGTDRVIGYRATQFEEVVHEVDVVIDPIGGDTQKRSLMVLRKGVILVATLGISSPQVSREYGVRGKGVRVHPDTAQLNQIAARLDAGNLKPAVTSALPLAEAAQAHALSQTGHVRGKIVLKVGD